MVPSFFFFGDTTLLTKCVAVHNENDALLNQLNISLLSLLLFFAVEGRRKGSNLSFKTLRKELRKEVRKKSHEKRKQMNKTFTSAGK